MSGAEDGGGNVTPISKGRKLSSRATAMYARFRPAGDVQAETERPYLVKGWIDRGQTSVLYGPSNVGKTFLALDIARHVDKGESWAGRRVTRAPVLYVAAEGAAGLNNRVAALGGANFWLLDGPLNLGPGSLEAGDLCDALDRLAEVQGAFGLIVIDTLARTIGGGDESSNRDMSAYLGALDLIRARSGAHVMVIHHVGKTVSAGPRGAYALPAGVDAAFELTEQDGGVIHCEAKKQRDDKKGRIFAYRLREVELGTDQDGDPVTSCVVEECDPVATGAARKPALSSAARTALEALDVALSEGGSLNAGLSCCTVGVDLWRACCDRLGISGSSKPAARSMSFQRAKDALVSGGLVKIKGDQVWRAEK